MTDAPRACPFEPPESDDAATRRLLPWTSVDDKPAYLTGSGFLADFAEEIEELQLNSAHDVLSLVHVVLDNPDASPAELRFAAQRLYESLGDTLRVVVSRSARGELASADESTPTLLKSWTHDPQCVARARHELRRALTAWELPELADAAELVLSELLTNSLRHAQFPREHRIGTRYERIGTELRIEVHDASETWPVLQKPAPDAVSGRGLALVDAVTGGRWGVSERVGIGKLVWAMVAADDEGEPVGVAG